MCKRFDRRDFGRGVEIGSVRSSHRLRLMWGMSVASVLVLSACSAVTNGGEYNYECPEGDLVLLDVVNISDGARSEAILGERLDSVQTTVERAFDCEARFTLIAWSSSSATSRTLFDGDLITKGASEIGRDRKIAKATKSVMGEIRTAVEKALQEVDGSESDMMGGFSIIADYVSGLGTSADLEVTMYADGISTVGDAANNSPTMSEADMVALTENLGLTQVGDVPITILGVGRVSGTAQPPEDYVANIRAYLTAMCAKVTSSCRVATAVTKN